MSEVREAREALKSCECGCGHIELCRFHTEYYWARCRSCEKKTEQFKTEAEAVNAWNTRPTSPTEGKQSVEEAVDKVMYVISCASLKWCEDHYETKTDAEEKAITAILTNALATEASRVRGEEAKRITDALLAVCNKCYFWSGTICVKKKEAECTMRDFEQAITPTREEKPTLHERVKAARKTKGQKAYKEWRTTPTRDKGGE